MSSDVKWIIIWLKDGYNLFHMHGETYVYTAACKCKQRTISIQNRLILFISFHMIIRSVLMLIPVLFVYTSVKFVFVIKGARVKLIYTRK